MPKVTQQTTRPATIAPAGGVLSRIAPISFDDSEGIKCAFYGRSGSGKTTVWGTFPGKILAVLCSGGDKPGELRSLNTVEGRKKVDQVVLQHSNEIPELVKYVESNRSKYNTLVIDHATGVQDKVLAEILGLAELPIQKSWGLATREQYGQCTAICKDHFKKVLGFSGNVVIVAQEREFEGGDTTSELVMPTIGMALSPSLAGWLNTAVDYICMTFIRQRTEQVVTKIGGKDHVTVKPAKGVDYCLRTGPHSVYTTKFRVPRGGPELPDVIVDPTYGKIMEVLKGR